MSRSSSTHHLQVAIEHAGRRAKVDELLAPTILALWRLGYPTRFSCQGDPHEAGFYGYAYIHCGSIAEAHRLVQLVAANWPRGRRLRVHHWEVWSSDNGRRRVLRPTPIDGVVFAAIRKEASLKGWLWEGASLFFPARDIPRIEVAVGAR